LFLHLKQNENEIKRKQSEKRLFRFALKQNKKSGSEMKRNEKILEAKQSENTLLWRPQRAK
jgi:hypothetical protein